MEAKISFNSYLWQDGIVVTIDINRQDRSRSFDNFKDVRGVLVLPLGVIPRPASMIAVNETFSATVFNDDQRPLAVTPGS